MPHVSRETASLAARLAVPALVEMTAMMAAFAELAGCLLLIGSKA